MIAGISNPSPGKKEWGVGHTTYLCLYLSTVSYRKQKIDSFKGSLMFLALVTDQKIFVWMRKIKKIFLRRDISNPHILKALKLQPKQVLAYKNRIEYVAFSPLLHVCCSSSQRAKTKAIEVKIEKTEIDYGMTKDKNSFENSSKVPDFQHRSVSYDKS